MNKLTLELIKLLYLRFSAIFGKKFTSDHTPEFIEIWCQEWLEGLSTITIEAMKPALADCRKLEWPPSIGEFLKICDKRLNVPTVQECLHDAVRKDFSHPITKALYDKVGSWEMSHGSEKDLIKRFKENYAQEIENFRLKELSTPKLELLHDPSHGSEDPRSNSRGNGVRKAQEYLPRQ